MVPRGRARLALLPGPRGSPEPPEGLRGEVPRPTPPAAPSPPQLPLASAVVPSAVHCGCADARRGERGERGDEGSAVPQEALSSPEKRTSRSFRPALCTAVADAVSPASACAMSEMRQRQPRNGVGSCQCGLRARACVCVCVCVCRWQQHISLLAMRCGLQTRCVRMCMLQHTMPAVCNACT